MFVTQLPAFKSFADIRLEKGICIDERKATKEEMEMIINDDFPYNYDGATLSCINHDGPDQFIVQNKGGSWFIVEPNDIAELQALCKVQMEQSQNEGLQLQ